MGVWQQTTQRHGAQAVGGGVKRFEETMESSPLVGPAITGQQLRSMESFNTSAIGKIIDDLNRDLPEAKQINVGEIPAGREGFLKAEKAAKEAYDAKVELSGRESFAGFERSVLLYSLDTHWREHLAALDHLRQGIHLRGYAQKDPKQEYRREAFELYGELLNVIKDRKSTRLNSSHT